MLTPAESKSNIDSDGRKLSKEQQKKEQGEELILSFILMN